MRCQICDRITENCSFDKETNAMETVCDRCRGAINETVGENQQDDQEELEDYSWFRL